MQSTLLTGKFLLILETLHSFLEIDLLTATFKNPLKLRSFQINF